MNLSIVIPFHRESFRALGPLRVIAETTRRFSAASISAEWIFVLDRADEPTRELIRSFTQKNSSMPVKILEADCGDAGLARQAGIAASQGEAIGILDGDDCISPEFWIRGLDQLKQRPKAIFRPEINVHYGNEQVWWAHPKEDLSDLMTGTLFYQNLWSSACLASRELFLAVPYRAARSEDGFGFEDWDWNIRSSFADYTNIPVSKTIRFAQQRSSNQRGATHIATAAELPPTGILLRPEYLERVERLIQFQDTSESRLTKRPRFLRHGLLHLWELLLLWLIHPFMKIAGKKCQKWEASMSEAISTALIGSISDRSSWTCWGMTHDFPAWAYQEIADMAHFEPALRSVPALLGQGEYRNLFLHFRPEPKTLRAWLALCEWLNKNVSGVNSLEIPAAALFKGLPILRQLQLTRRAWTEQESTRFKLFSDPGGFAAYCGSGIACRERVDRKISVDPRNLEMIAEYYSELKMSGDGITLHFETDRVRQQFEGIVGFSPLQPGAVD